MSFGLLEKKTWLLCLIFFFLLENRSQATESETNILGTFKAYILLENLHEYLPSCLHISTNYQQTQNYSVYTSMKPWRTTKSLNFEAIPALRLADEKFSDP